MVAEKGHHDSRDFWEQNRQCAFFDVRVFNLFVLVFHCPDVITSMSRRNVEHMMNGFKRCWEIACFSPLVFAATGGMGPAATTVYRKLA